MRDGKKGWVPAKKQVAFMLENVNSQGLRRLYLCGTDFQPSYPTNEGPVILNPVRELSEQDIDNVELELNRLYPNVNVKRVTPNIAPNKRLAVSFSSSEGARVYHDRIDYSETLRT